MPGSQQRRTSSDLKTAWAMFGLCWSSGGTDLLSEVLSLTPGGPMFVIRRNWVIPSLIASGVLVTVAGGAIAAVEADIVTSFPRGIWWSLSLMTTVGFLGAPPATTPGAVLSIALMLGGFFLLALVSAALASMFVREDEKPAETREDEAMHRLQKEVTDLKTEITALRISLLHDSETRDQHSESPLGRNA